MAPALNPAELPVPARETARPPIPPGALQARDPGALQACVDAELARRGLNAFGGPPGAPPPGELAHDGDASHRYSWVLAHHPPIATACTVGRPFQ
jgi:hypothetical protein